MYTRISHTSAGDLMGCYPDREAMKAAHRKAGASGYAWTLLGMNTDIKEADTNDANGS